MSLILIQFYLKYKNFNKVQFSRSFFVSGLLYTSIWIMKPKAQYSNYTFALHELLSFKESQRKKKDYI